jgi:hypothetical protein
LALLGLALAVLVGQAAAESGPAQLRLALLSQWSIQQHRHAWPALAGALDAGVVDRLVFQWQRGRIQRESLVTKPIRGLVAAEAEGLGGRGSVRLAGVRAPSGPAAWTDVALGGPLGPGDVLVLEIGGELNTVRQVLESVFLVGPGGELTAVPVSPVALTGTPGVPVVSAAPGNVLPPDVAARFRRVADGLELLVVRSRVATIVNGAMTPNGPADASPNPGSGTGDWREGDRVLVRLTAAWRAAAPPTLVLGWKDRVLRPDPDGMEFPRASLSRPLGS